LRAGEERPKPNGGRLREFSDSGRASLELALFSTKPIPSDMEIVALAESLTFMACKMGAEEPLVQKILDGQTPRHRAEELVMGTKVRDAAFRKSLYDGGATAVEAAHDPMIDFARIVDPQARALRKISEAQNEIKNQAHAAIARAHNAIFGNAGYPDATFTLRLAFGAVKGYQERGENIAPFTTFAGLYARAAAMNNRPPFDLTPLWHKRKSRLTPQTPLDFVSTDDIIGGNSGSPVVNRAGEFVGIIFDGNLESLPWDYAYDDNQGRATSVDSAAIMEALNRVYQAKSLARELSTGSMSK
jgi:hypothetical protein